MSKLKIVTQQLNKNKIETRIKNKMWYNHHSSIIQI